MSTVRVDVKLGRIAAEMFARQVAADILVVEAGAAVVCLSAAAQFVAVTVCLTQAVVCLLEHCSAGLVVEAGAEVVL